MKADYALFEGVRCNVFSAIVYNMLLRESSSNWSTTYTIHEYPLVKNLPVPRRRKHINLQCYVLRSTGYHFLSNI